MRASVYPLLGCLLAVGCGGVEGPGTVEVGRRAPDFSLPALDGTTVTARSLEGEVVVLTFWASWCPSCVQEIPTLNLIAAAGQAKVIGVALDKEWPGAVKRSAARHGITYTVVGGDEELFQRFGGSAIPYTLVLDRSRRVVKVYRGPVSPDVLERDVRTINQAGKGGQG